jgi:hypothetical protein
VKNYKAIWDNLSGTFADASFVVGYLGDEEEIRANGQHTAKFLTSVLQIERTDRVLEIGCGVARIERWPPKPGAGVRVPPGVPFPACLPWFYILAGFSHICTPH